MNITGGAGISKNDVLMLLWGLSLMVRLQIMVRD